MQYLVTLALLVGLLGWLMAAYHRLSLLREQSVCAWEKAALAIEQRNIYLLHLLQELSVQAQPGLLLLRRLRRATEESKLALHAQQERGLLRREGMQRLSKNEHRIIRMLPELQSIVISHRAAAQKQWEDLQQLDRHLRPLLLHYDACCREYKGRQQEWASWLLAGLIDLPSAPEFGEHAKAPQPQD